MTRTITHFSAEDHRQMIETRRDLHAHPELGFEETRTAALVAERLRAMGLAPRTSVGRTGVLASIAGARPGRTVLLRADMDALPIQEENDTPYRSRNPGRMHACGHDCHTSILLGVARRLTADAREMAGSVRLCFQPAEEIAGGATAMIADGALGPPRPAAAFGVHVWQNLEVGRIGVTPGPMMAAVDEFTVTVMGRGSHGAMPHAGVDPVTCLAQMITSLQTLVSREIDPFLPAVVSVTRIEAGAAFNIIPESAWMNGTVRVFDPAVWQELPGRFERIVRGVAGAFGCRVEIRYDRHNQPTINDPAMAELARQAAAEVVGEMNVVSDVRTMGGEDFSAFLREIPGCFVMIGSRNEQRGLVHDHHHPRFDVDEDSLAIGAEVLLRVAHKALQG